MGLSKLPRKELPVNLLQSATIHVSVYLGRRDISMPQHRLYRAKISAAFKQMSGKRMTKHMR